MSLDTVLGGLAELGLKPYLDSEGRPRLSGPRDEITDAVREALAAYREELLERLGARTPAPPGAGARPPADPKPEPAPAATLPRTWYWPHGHTGTEFPGDSGYGDPAYHPVGAWFWRYAGEIKLRAVPGRPGAWAITTEVCA